ncbi:unnamed protein product [Sphagnum compactum]
MFPLAAGTAVALPIVGFSLIGIGLATFLGGVAYAVYRIVKGYHKLINSTDAILDLAIKEVLQWQCSTTHKDNSMEAVSKETKLELLETVARAIGNYKTAESFEGFKAWESVSVYGPFWLTVIVKASSGPGYVVGCCNKVDKEKLVAGTRVALDMTTLTIMKALPRELTSHVDLVVYNMLHDDPGKVSYSVVGGLSDQIWELRESIELPLMNFELFMHVGINPPKGVMLYGPPGTGKTLLARAIASNIDANFLKVVSSASVIQEVFGYACDHQVYEGSCNWAEVLFALVLLGNCIFMDEIDAIGGRQFSEGTSAD